MRNIIGKGRIYQLESLRNEGFKKAELSTVESCLHIDPKIHRDIEIFSMHEDKGKFCIEKSIVWGNIGDNSRLGDLSEELLKRQINYAHKHGIKRFVFHPGNANIFVCEREVALSTVVKRIKRIYDSFVDCKGKQTLNVKLCIENSEFRPDITAYHNERLVVDAKHVNSLLKKADEKNIKLHLVVDIEHLYVTSIFKLIYDDLKNEYESITSPSTCIKAKREADKKAEKMLLARAKEDDIKKEISRFLSNFFKELGCYAKRVEAIHVCGSDYHNYKKIKENTTRTKGSHLPICYSSDDKGKCITDKVNHLEYLNLLDEYVDDKVPLVIEVEVPFSETKNYIEYVSESRDRLNKIQKFTNYNKLN